jgi:hypothetical protein
MPDTTLIFLAIVVTGAVLLETPLPREVTLWGSFIASMLLPALVRSVRHRRHTARRTLTDEA